MKFLLSLLLTLLLVGCGTPRTAATDTFEEAASNQAERHEETEEGPHTHEEEAVSEPAAQAAAPVEAGKTEAQPAAPSQGEAPAEMQVILVPSELVVGPNRFAVGLVGPEGSIIKDAAVHFQYFDLSEGEPQLESEADATLLQTLEGQPAIFAHERTFERAGEWGVQVEARLPDGKTLAKGIAFTVQADTASVAPDEAAPAPDTPTAADVGGDLSRLTSAADPNPALYEVSLEEALASDKPTVLLFATPAFCETRFCGPDYEIVSDLQQRYGDQFNFIHVEVYTGLPNPAENNWETAPAMAEFGLTTEPWLYLIDTDGTVRYRVEGLFTEDEIERQLVALSE